MAKKAKRFVVVDLGFIYPIVRPYKRIRNWGVQDTVEWRIVVSGSKPYCYGIAKALEAEARS